MFILLPVKNFKSGSLPHVSEIMPSWNFIGYFLFNSKASCPDAQVTHHQTVLNDYFLPIGCYKNRITPRYAIYCLNIYLLLLIHFLRVAGLATEEL